MGLSFAAPTDQPVAAVQHLNLAAARAGPILAAMQRVVAHEHRFAVGGIHRVLNRPRVHI